MADSIVINFGGYPEILPYYPYQYFKYMFHDKTISKNKFKKLVHKANKKRGAKLKRQRILERDNMQCVYCSVSLTMDTLTLDHIHPQSQGGSNKDENLCSSCATCNVKKADMPVEQFLLIIKADKK